MPKGTQKRRGRPELDIAIRIRNWLWYSEIKAATQLSDDRLDQRFVHIQLKQGHDPIRQRVFYEIKSMGSSPDELRGYRIKKSIFEKVHENGQFADIKFNFELPLWRYLSDPTVSTDEYRSYLKQEIERLGLFRLDTRDAEVARIAMGRDEPAVQYGVNRVFSAMVHHFANQPNLLHSICVLTALFKEAYAEYELELAQAISEIIMMLSRQAAMSTLLPTRMKYLLDKLIQDRILKNIWVREYDFAKYRTDSSATRKRHLQDFIDWYNDPKCPPRNILQSGYPIVAKTNRTEWFVENRELIRKIRAPFSNIQHPKVDDPIHEDAKRMGELLNRVFSLEKQTGLEIAALNIPERVGHGCLENNEVIPNCYTWLPEPEGSKFPGSKKDN